MFNINQFKSNLNEGGVIRSNHGQIIFSSPKSLARFYPDNRDILVRCEQLSIPPVWFTTDDTVRRYGYGPVDKAPHLPQFDPLTCSFIADKNGMTHSYFTDWLSSIVNFDSSSSMLNKNKFGVMAYETQYRKTYVTDMFVKIYDVNTDDILEYRLIDCFPSAIHESSIAWHEQDNIVRVSVVFQFRDWSLIGKKEKTGTDVFTDVSRRPPILGNLETI